MTNTFEPKTERIKKLAEIYPERVEELKQIFDKTTNIYIDYANVIHWANKLKWHVEIKRLYQLLSSFNTIGAIRFYNGTLIGNFQSEKFNKDAEKQGYDVKTKPVKIMKISIDVSSIPTNSPAILKNFIKRPLLKKLTLETIEYLNGKLKELNDQGAKHIEIRKCNFDVEIGTDMLVDSERNDAEVFVLWSGDSDFADTAKKILEAGRKIVVFGTARRVSKELSDLREKGLVIFEIQKIRNFICWKREIQSKGDPGKEAPKQ